MPPSQAALAVAVVEHELRLLAVSEWFWSRVLYDALTHFHMVHSWHLVGALCHHLTDRITKPHDV